MTTQLTLEVPDSLMAVLREIADAELRTPEGQALWYLRAALNRKPHGKRARQGEAAELERLEDYKPVFTELARLHLQQGKPSCRGIAEAIRYRDGGYTISHSTVNNMIGGTSVPSWGSLEKVTRALNGDLEGMRALWMAAAEGGSVAP